MIRTDKMVHNDAFRTSHSETWLRPKIYSLLSANMRVKQLRSMTGKIIGNNEDIYEKF